jgi:tRNA(Arg) A34 adenosine deaminase TadA
MHFAVLIGAGGKPLHAPQKCSLAGTKHISGHRSASAHAEVNALKHLKQRHSRRATKATLMVTRFVFSHGQLVLRPSRPCFHCLKTLQAHGVRKVIFSDSDSDSDSDSATARTARTAAPGPVVMHEARVSNLLSSGHFTVSSGHRSPSPLQSSHHRTGRHHTEHSRRNSQ